MRDILFPFFSFETEKVDQYNFFLRSKVTREEEALLQNAYETNIIQGQRDNYTQSKTALKWTEVKNLNLTFGK